MAIPRTTAARAKFRLPLRLTVKGDTPQVPATDVEFERLKLPYPLTD